MKIDLIKLRQVTEVIFSYLEQDNIKTIEINEDFYWNIKQEELYNPYVTPVQLDLGQLSDDWETLQLLLSKQRTPIAYDLVALSALLKIIGEKIIK